jgi:hypothetical protein
MRRAMMDDMQDKLQASMGGDRIQKAGESRTAQESSLLNSMKITKPGLNKLELRRKITDLLQLEAEQKYISSTNSIEPAFDTANLKYLASERGRNFGKSPSAEFKKEVLIRMLKRRTDLDSAFNRTRTTPQMSQLINVS